MKLFFLLFLILSFLFISEIVYCQNVIPLYGSGEFVRGSIYNNTFQYYSITGMRGKYLHVTFLVSSSIPYDVYVKRNSAPSLSNYDFKLTKGVVLTNSVYSQSEKWFIGIYASQGSTAYEVNILNDDYPGNNNGGGGGIAGWVIGVIIASIVVGLIVVIASIVIPILICCGVCSGLICCASKAAVDSVDSARTPIIEKTTTTNIVYHKATAPTQQMYTPQEQQVIPSQEQEHDYQSVVYPTVQQQQEEGEVRYQQTGLYEKI
ncbi:hypothetical protein ABK040_014262 [Willaertia magna]